jgi:hypothetical protein
LGENSPNLVTLLPTSSLSCLDISSQKVKLANAKEDQAATHFLRCPKMSSFIFFCLKNLHVLDASNFSRLTKYVRNRKSKFFLTVEPKYFGKALNLHFHLLKDLPGLIGERTRDLLIVVYFLSAIPLSYSGSSTLELVPFTYA